MSSISSTFKVGTHSEVIGEKYTRELVDCPPFLRIAQSDELCLNGVIFNASVPCYEYPQLKRCQGNTPNKCYDPQCQCRWVQDVSVLRIILYFIVLQ